MYTFMYFKIYHSFYLQKIVLLFLGMQQYS